MEFLEGKFRELLNMSDNFSQMFVAFKEKKYIFIFNFTKSQLSVHVTKLSDYTL